ncbi:hypothetical protein [Moraxella oculi]|uniref:Uncharacterized protein n=1 Tax=Moraxella oculi TaxID=2940516 RepID=A0ABW8U8E3_9GAMM
MNCLLCQVLDYGLWLRPLVEGAKVLAKNPVAQGGATGGATTLPAM